LVVDSNKRADRHGEEPGADIALYLARHGAHVEVEQASSHGSPVADILLSFAADHGMDLIVIGVCMKLSIFCRASDRSVFRFASMQIPVIAISRRWTPDLRCRLSLPMRSGRVSSARMACTSTCSAIASASSASIPRYRAVL
jgi:hypothetical protein